MHTCICIVVSKIVIHSVLFSSLIWSIKLQIFLSNQQCQPVAIIDMKQGDRWFSPCVKDGLSHSTELAFSSVVVLCRF